MNNDLMSQVELSRILAHQCIADEKRKLAEQYFTPSRVSKLMAGMFSIEPKCELTVLDPCCGVGNLSAALLDRASNEDAVLKLTLVEKDSYLVDCARNNFSGFQYVDVRQDDFFKFIAVSTSKFDRIVLNPPYSKINSTSEIARLCKSFLGYAESNLYSAFIACCLKLLSDDGELVAVVPRSFCNGPMFKRFRSLILVEHHIHQLYLFESRKIFAESEVLQETVVIKIARAPSAKVKVSHEKLDGEIDSFEIDIEKISFSADEQKFIHIPVRKKDDELLSKMARFQHSLLSLGFRASTGKVVDFRCGEWLRRKSSANTAQLFYQDAVQNSKMAKFVARSSEKLPFLRICDESAHLFVPKKNYVLVRRISFKESTSRLICSPLLEKHIVGDVVGIENHLNYIWGEKSDLTESGCLGLSAYLSSQSVDAYIRRFSGHTQINAADLNSLPVPTIKELEALGAQLAGNSISSISLAAEKNFFSP